MFHHEASGLEFPDQRLRAEILEPVVDHPGARRLHDGVLVQHDLFALVFEDVQKAVIVLPGPESVQQVLFTADGFLPEGEGVQGVGIEQDGASGVQECRELPDETVPLFRTVAQNRT